MIRSKRQCNQNKQNRGKREKSYKNGAYLLGVSLQCLSFAIVAGGHERNSDCPHFKPMSTGCTSHMKVDYNENFCYKM